MRSLPAVKKKLEKLAENKNFSMTEWLEDAIVVAYREIDRK